MREQVRNMQAELQQALNTSAAQQQILIPPPNINKRIGASKKMPDSNLAVIQQSIIDAGFSALGVSGDMTSRNVTAASSYSAASAPPRRERVQPQTFTSSKQMLNFPPVSQISSATLYPAQYTFASRQASAQCTSALPQTSVQYTTAPMQQFTQPSIQPALIASQPSVQSQYIPPLIQPFPQASFAQQTKSTAPPPLVQVNAATQAAAQRKLDKFPDFYKHSPQLWISLLESQFTAAGITAPQDKYYHLVTKLGHDVTVELKHSLITLPRNSEYNALKAILLRKYVENDMTKIKQLSENLNGMQDLTPSEYFNHLASASDQWIPRESILTLWKKNLPPTISSGLSSEITLENEAENVSKADELFDSYNRNSQQQPAFNFCIAPTVDELRRFLGMINFYDECIPHLAHLQISLHKYTSGNKKKDKSPITWDDESLSAFEACKQRLADAALLAFPVDTAPIRICSHASSIAMGGVLEQQNSSGQWFPLSFFSRKFNNAQRNYSTYDRELTAAVESIKHFQYYVESRKFILGTDHKPLLQALSQKHEKAIPRLARQLEYLSLFEIGMVYLPGIHNNVADALSRIESLYEISAIDQDTYAMLNCINAFKLPTAIDMGEFCNKQAEDQELSEILKDPLQPLKLAKFSWPVNKQFFYAYVQDNNIRPFLPKSLRKAIFDIYHGLSHPSGRVTDRLIRRSYVWPNIYTSIS
uniref:RNA-directed DNA polymerase n=1 Tax=Trichogramma kaykai TaxID=54128 RepID=A0ABD2WZ15_9HYME